MSSDHDRIFQALEEIVKFKKLLVDVNPDLNQTLSQLFQHEKDIYSSLLVKSPEEKKVPDPHNTNITTIESKPLFPEANPPPQQKFCAYFSFKDVTLRDNVKKFLPEDVVYLNSLDERDVDQHMVLLGLNAERMIPDDLKYQINKMSINSKTLHMITFCPKGLHASDTVIDVGEKKVEVSVFAFDREYKCMPREDNKTITQILEKAGYKKPNKVQAKPEEKSLQDKFVKTQTTSEIESKNTEQLEVNNKADMGSEYYKQRNINGLHGKEVLYNNKIEQKSKFEDEFRQLGQGDPQRKYERKIQNKDNGQDSSKKSGGGGFFGLFS